MKRCNAGNYSSTSRGMSGSSGTTSLRTMSSSEQLRPGPAVCRFFIKYRYYVVPIGVFILVQLLLAVCLFVISPEDSVGFFGPRLKWTVSSEMPYNTNYAKSDAKTVAISTSPSSLDLSTLTFTPECNITSKDALSAINRAKTQVCKKQLATTACEIVNDSLYPKTLPRYCLSNGTTYGRHLGCYKDDKTKRILPDNYILLKANNSPQNCVDACLQSGFQYAGVQYSVECFCGNSEPSSTFKISSKLCNMKCPIRPQLSEDAQSDDKYCGGYFAMNVFETGVFFSRDEKSKVFGLEDYSPDKVVHLEPVRIVFFLTLNGRALRQVLRVIKALFHEQHYFYIHVDARQDYLYRELLNLTHKLPNNVKFMANRRATIWGGASLLTILLNGMKDLSDHANDWNWDWDYVINLSESDFPLKTTKQLEYFLSLNKGKNFLKSHGRDVQKFIQKQGLDKTFDECEYRMWRVGDRKLPTGIVVDGGSDWIALHRDFVGYFVNSDDELVKGLKTVFKHTLLPAESFFHTLLRNSDMCETFVDNNLHVTNWRRKLGCKCQYRNIVDWCGCSPNDFRLPDWSRLQLTEPRLLFFGRKFESIVNQGIVNQLEAWLYPDRLENNFSTLDRFWLSLYHHQDISPKPEDALVTLGRSLSRIASKSFLSKCFPTTSPDDFVNNTDESAYSVELIEVTAYNHDDVFEGILVKFHSSLKDTTGENLELSVEAWFKAESKLEMAASNYRTAKFQSLLKDIRIGGDYEQKEQIFRNFAGALGPFSEPTLTYSVHSTEPFNISIDWINPRSEIQSSTNVTVTDGTTANFVKPTLKSPLMPGNWSVKIFTIDHDLIFRVKFLVLPLEIFQGKIISASEERIINSEDSATPTSSQYLQQKIDTLVSRHYDIQDFCLEKQVNHATLSRWISKSDRYSNEESERQIHNSLEAFDTSLCSHTQWSSFYPDPKSTIIGIDSKTGLLMP